MEVRENVAEYIYPRKKGSAKSNDKVKSLFNAKDFSRPSKCREEVSSLPRA